MKRVVPQEEPLRILFYGKPGSTKTRTSATACNDPRTAPVLYLESGGNPISLREYKTQPDIIHIDALEDFTPIYEWLKNGQDPNSEFCRLLKLSPPYKTVMIDQITDIQRIVFNVATGNKGTALDAGVIPNPSQIQHFNQVLGYMIKFAGLFWSLPMHVIITSQEREDKDDTTGVIEAKPLLWGQSAGEVGGYAYLVARLVHRERVDVKTKALMAGALPTSVDSVALFMPTRNWHAKDQYGMRDEAGNLLPYMVNPSIPKLLDKIYGPGRGPTGKTTT